MDKDLVVIIMAGGLGTRMNSEFPKVIHKLNGIAMINYVIKNVLQLYENKFFNLKKIYIVVGKYKQQIKEAIDEYFNDNKIINNHNNWLIDYVNQYIPFGTGHAIQCCVSELRKYKNSNTLILSGDVPLFSTQSMCNLLNNINKIKIVVANIKNPHGYGRIITKNHIFDRIVEHNDCNSQQLTISKINCGIYAINTEILCKWIFEINNHNSKGEYYLTDIVEIIKRGENINIDLYELPAEQNIEITGINTITQLNELEFLLVK